MKFNAIRTLNNYILFFFFSFHTRSCIMNSSKWINKCRWKAKMGIKEEAQAKERCRRLYDEPSFHLILLFMCAKQRWLNDINLNPIIPILLMLKIWWNMIYWRIKLAFHTPTILCIVNSCDVIIWSNLSYYKHKIDCQLYNLI